VRARRDFAHVQRPIGVRGIRFRSKSEANYAAYLQWLVDLGQIALYLYEPVVYWFSPGSRGAVAQGLAGVRRGVTSYKPDFLVRSTAGVEYHEVKGYLDPRSKTALARMARYYPEVKVVLIDSKQMRTLGRQVAGIVPGWIP
jgi:hypothetical protein